MKASVLYGINDLRYVEDFPLPTLKKDEVLVKVSHSGICGSDVARVFKTGTYHFPTVIGHEFSGVVADVADKSLHEWIGKRVGIFPLKPCFECDNCKNGHYEMCDNYDYLGSRCDGGFEEYVAVPVWNLIQLPDAVSLEQAAMLEPVSVAIHALNQVSDLSNKTVAIIGPGAIGNLLGMIAKTKGAENVIMIGRTQSKLDFAKQHSADFVVNSTTEDVMHEIMSITDGCGVDVAVEGTGASESLTLAIRIARKGSEIVLMGNPIGDCSIDKAIYWSILRKQLTLHGTWNSSFKAKRDDWSEAIRYFENGSLDISQIISHRLSFDMLLDGLNIMRNPDFFSNKVMLNND